MAVAPGANCTPDLMIAVNKCSPCYSDYDLKAAIVALLFLINNTRSTIDATTIASEACDWKCLDSHSLLARVVNMFYEHAVNDELIADGTSLSDLIVCVKCIPEKTLEAGIVDQLCTFIGNHSVTPT